jgi:hypothetical protein
MIQCYKVSGKIYNQNQRGSEIMIVAKNLDTKEEISKIYDYKMLYDYFLNIQGNQDLLEYDVDIVINTIPKSLVIADFSKTGRQEIRLRKIKNKSKRESSVKYEASPMNVVKEDSKSSVANQDLRLRGEEKARDFNHQRHSSKTTKKYEMSLMSYGYGEGTIMARTFTKAKSSVVAFNKQEQKKVRKEIKRKKVTQSVTIPKLPNKIIEDKKESEKEAKQDIEESPIKKIEKKLKKEESK